MVGYELYKLSLKMTTNQQTNCDGNKKRVREMEGSVMLWQGEMTPRLMTALTLCALVMVVTDVG